METNQFLIYVLISRNKLINIIRRINQLLIHRMTPTKLQLQSDDAKYDASAGNQAA